MKIVVKKVIVHFHSNSEEPMVKSTEIGKIVEDEVAKQFAAVGEISEKILSQMMIRASDKTTDPDNSK